MRDIPTVPCRVPHNVVPDGRAGQQDRRPDVVCLLYAYAPPGMRSSSLVIPASTGTTSPPGATRNSFMS
jgi:hypothetical protein